MAEVTKVKGIFSIVIAVLCISCSPIYSKRLAALPEVGKPQDMAVDGGQLFISDQIVKVHMYSIKDFKYQGQISRQGEGPGECKDVPGFTVTPDDIFLYSLGKGIFFSRNGKIKREIRIPRKGTTSIAPLGEDFVWQVRGENKRNGRNYFDISIYTYTENEGLKYKKLLYYFDLPPRKKKGAKWYYRVIRDYRDYVICKDKIFIGDSTRGLFVVVFDSQGNELYKIKLDKEKIRITEEYKTKLLDIFRALPQWELLNGLYKVVFPEYFPAFYRFSVDNDKVYFLTYKMKGDNQRETIITDLKGNLLKRVYVPWIENELYIDYAIENDKFYYLEANEDTGEWELHMEEIK